MNNQRRLPYRHIFAIIAIALVVFGLGFYAGQNSGYAKVGSGANQELLILETSDVLSPKGVNFTPLWKTWKLINEKHIDGFGTTTKAITDEEKVWGAASGLVNSLGDPYSTFFPPDEAELFKENISGSFGGVGMEVGMRGGVLTVIAPLEGTPAKKIGIKAGDIISSIDDKPTIGMSVDKAVKLIRGERGTKVKLTIIREGKNEPMEFVIIRDIIEVPVLRLGDDQSLKVLSTGNGANGGGNGLRPDGVFVIRLFSFSANSPELFRNALRKFIISGSDKLILDLRSNPGGYLEAAVDMSSWFLPEGKIIVREVYGKDGKERVHRSKPGKDIFNDRLKMAILIDKGSASASEIMSGALREHGIARLVGEKTFGKGSVQELVPVTDNTFVKLTIAKWLTPNGLSISDGGLKPDIEVILTKEDIEASRDSQMERAAKLLVENK